MSSKIRCVSDAIESIQNTNFERGQLLFRGHVNCTFELIPSLFRPHISDARSLEAACFESLLLGKRHPYSISYDPIEHLSHLQHFGFPTRLLDWTADLFIALFFACYDNKDEHASKDGDLLIIQRNLYPQLVVNGDQTKKFENPFRKDTFHELVDRISIDDMWIFEPVIKNPRMRIQDGCFMFFSAFPIDPSEPKFVSLKDYHAGRNKFIRKKNEGKSQEEKEQELWIGNKLIDKDSKKSILIELDEKYGISQDTIYVKIPEIERAQFFYDELLKKAELKAAWIRNNRDG